MWLDKDVVEFLSRERGVDPAFIEKDWHAVRVLKALSEYSHEQITTLFTGGTSLSKGYGLLKRFSEDLDFRARFDSETPPNKSQKRFFRNNIIATLKNIEGISLDEGDIQIDGLGFKIQLVYPKLFNAPDGIRAELQIEFSYTQPRLGTEPRSVASFVSDYKGEPPEASILCLSPVEIAADKFSSLVWRVLKRDRSNDHDDPAMLRHLHDLCALQEVISQNRATMIETVFESFAIDQDRQKRNVGLPLLEAAAQAFDAMREDVLYRSEYEQFVDAMSYAKKDETIVFREALDHFGQLIELFK